jgi:hypothetical protein
VQQAWIEEYEFADEERDIWGFLFLEDEQIE